MDGDALSKLLDLLFGEDDGTEVDAVLIVDAPMPVLDQYVGKLMGLEGEEVMEIALRPDPRAGGPPLQVQVAYTRPFFYKDGEIDCRVPSFDTITYKFRMMDWPNVCYYERTTPLFREEQDG